MPPARDEHLGRPSDTSGKSKLVLLRQKQLIEQLILAGHETDCADHCAARRPQILTRRSMANKTAAIQAAAAAHAAPSLC
jgi:hypothetical protein